MLPSSTNIGAVVEKFLEFDRVATVLDMPEDERLGILNVSRELYSGLRQGATPASNQVRPELERRLSYALPLMRRLAGKRPFLHMPLTRPARVPAPQS